MPPALGVPATIIRRVPAGFDPHGDPADGAVQRTDVTLMGVAPRTGEPGTASRDIDRRGREGVIEGVVAYAPFTTDIAHTDEIEIHAGPYQGLWKVNGQGGAWVNSPFTGWEAGQEINLDRRKG